MTGITIHSTNLENLAVGDLNVKWSARGDRILRYYVDVRHKKLNLHKEVSAPELFILQSKMDTLIAAWDEKYEQFVKKSNVIAGYAAAEEMTADAVMRLDSLANILQHTLKVDDRIDWEALKDKSEYPFPKSFPEPKPTSSPERQPEYKERKIGFFDLIFGRKARIIASAEEDHQAAVAAWKLRENVRTSDHKSAVSSWELRQKTFWDEYLSQKVQFQEEQAASHAEVDRLNSEIGQGNEDAVVEHASLILEESNYKKIFLRSHTKFNTIKMLDL